MKHYSNMYQFIFTLSTARVSYQFASGDSTCITILCAVTCVRKLRDFSMDQDNQNYFDDPTMFPGKRRRGRPRKDRSLNHGVNSLRFPRRSPILNHGGENTHVPPGFEQRNGNHGRAMGPVDDANDIVVGQVVSAVVEAVFDAGFLLSVRVGDSDTPFSGVVFKPGRYVPVSAENDVAPQVQMIRRNNISRPKENHAMVQFDNLNRNGTAYSSESPTANQVPKSAPGAASGSAVRRKRAPAMAIQPVPPTPSRGTVVPVVLQPVDLSNGIPPVTHIEPQATPTQAPAHMAASKAVKLVPITNRARASLPQTSAHLMNKGLQSENCIFSRPITGVLHEGKGKSTTLPSETLQGEEVNRNQVCFPPIKAENGESAHKISTKSSVGNPGVPCATHPVFIKPLQSIQPGLHKESIFERSENDGTE